MVVSWLFGGLRSGNVMVHAFLTDEGAEQGQIFLVKCQVERPADIEFDLLWVVQRPFLLKHLVEELALALEEHLADLTDKFV